MTTIQITLEFIKEAYLILLILYVLAMILISPLLMSKRQKRIYKTLGR